MSACKLQHDYDVFKGGCQALVPVWVPYHSSILINVRVYRVYYKYYIKKYIGVHVQIK